MPTTIETLTLPNFADANILEYSELSADAAKDQAVIGLTNPNNIAALDYLVITPGTENGELRQINTGGVTGSAITFSAALTLAHRNHEKVLKLFGNKIRVYRALNVDGYAPADSAFSVLGFSLIDADQPNSSYTDSLGGADYWYKATYYNDQTGAETGLSKTEAVRGGGYGHYVGLDEICDEAGIDKSNNLDRTKVAQRREEAESEIKGALSSAGYTLPLQTSNAVSYTPPVIVGVARLLSAGLALQRNFGTTKPSSAKDGKAKCDSARDTLERIGKNKVVLLDITGVMLAKASLVDGWPDDTTADVGTDGVHGEPAKATMSKIF